MCVTWVTLQVMAQDAYLQLENNTGLLVRRGGVVTFTSTNLSVSSNLDLRDPQEVTFDIFLPAKHGVLCFGDAACGADTVLRFTQQDLVAGRLVYHHDNSHQMSDTFNVTARVRQKIPQWQRDSGRSDVLLDIGVQIKIFPEDHQRAPTVLRNWPVVVDEGQRASINRDHLEVRHLDKTTTCTTTRCTTTCSTTTCSPRASVRPICAGGPRGQSSIGDHLHRPQSSVFGHYSQVPS